MSDDRRRPEGHCPDVYNGTAQNGKASHSNGTSCKIIKKNMSYLFFNSLQRINGPLICFVTF